MFERVKRFLKEVKVELTKVTWPTMAELRGSTGVVIITVLADHGLHRACGYRPVTSGSAFSWASRRGRQVGTRDGKKVVCSSHVFRA